MVFQTPPLRPRSLAPDKEHSSALHIQVLHPSLQKSAVPALPRAPTYRFSNYSRQSLCPRSKPSQFLHSKYIRLCYYIMPGLTSTEPLEKIPKCLMSLTNEILIFYTSTNRVPQITNRITIAKP